MGRKIKQTKERIADNIDLATRDAILDEFFFDLYRHRGRIYRVNFFRGISFGLGAFIGGTIIVTLVIVLLSWLASISSGPIHDFTQWIIDSLSRK